MFKFNIQITRNIDINTLAEETELKGTIKGVFLTQINGLFQTGDLSVRKEITLGINLFRYGLQKLQKESKF